MSLLLCAPPNYANHFLLCERTCQSRDIKNKILDYLFNLQVLSSEILSTQDVYKKKRD